jgi:hypothetical protein
MGVTNRMLRLLYPWESTNVSVGYEATEDLSCDKEKHPSRCQESNPNRRFHSQAIWLNLVRTKVHNYAFPKISNKQHVACYSMMMKVMMMIIVVVMVVVVVIIKKYKGFRLLTPGASSIQPLTLFSNIHYLEIFFKFISLMFSVVPLSPTLVYVLVFSFFCTLTSYPTQK